MLDDAESTLARLMREEFGEREEKKVRKPAQVRNSWPTIPPELLHQFDLLMAKEQMMEVQLQSVAKDKEI